MRIRVHIDRLVLDGLPVERRHAPAVRAAVEAVLGRLLADGGVGGAFGAGGAVPRLSGGTIVVGAATPPDVLGSQIAQAVHRSVAS